MVRCNWRALAVGSEVCQRPSTSLTIRGLNSLARYLRLLREACDLVVPAWASMQGFVYDEVCIYHSSILGELEQLWNETDCK